MKPATIIRLAGVALASALLALSSAAANATGTEAGTTVGNKAVVSYSVGNVTQAPIESSPDGNSTSGTGNGTNTSFVVDDKVVLTITAEGSGLITATPGSTTAVASFKVHNGGNASQGVKLSALLTAAGAPDPFGGLAGTSNVEIGTVHIYLESGGSAGYDSGDTPVAGGIASLAPDKDKTVYVVATIPTTESNGTTPLKNGDFAVVGLMGQATEDGDLATVVTDDSGSEWTPDTVQNVFADAQGTDDSAYDGKHSARSGYRIQTASLTITKTSQVVSDPVCAATSCSEPHAIPGAVMRYTITIANGSGPDVQTAKGISVTDDLSSQIGTTLDWNSALKVTPPSGTLITCTDAGTDNGAIHCEFTSDTVSVTGLALAPGEQATVTYDVTIR